MTTRGRTSRSNMCLAGAAYGSGGFTLVELLVAVVIMSIGVLALMTAMAASRDAQNRAMYIAVASNIAQGKIEQARNTKFDQLLLLAGTSSDPSLPAGNQIQVTVANYPVLELNQYQVQVTVMWPEANGQRTISYETLIAKKK